MKRSFEIAAALDSFVGRKDELEALREWLEFGARLVTLAGPPGAGKTRLSRQLAQQTWVRDRFDDVSFVDLSDASGPEDLIDALVALWNIPAVGSSFEERAAALAAAPRNTSSLVILDNFETVLDAATAVQQWAASLSDTFLITSTTALDVRGERVLTIGALATADGVELFLERAFAERAQRPSPGDSETAGRIAKQLDGLPLALELAARQAEILTPTEIEQRLGKAFELLDSAARDSPPRHRSLHAMVAWGWAQLAEAERELMQAAAVFEGDFTATALAAVVGASEAEVRNGLLSLRRRAMVTIPQGDDVQSRFALLKTIGTFARAQLDENPLAPRYFERHIAWFAALARAWEDDPNRPDAQLHAAFERERTNVVTGIRRATELLVAGSCYDDAVALAVALVALHERRGVVPDTPEIARALLDAAPKHGVDAGGLARLRAKCGELRGAASDEDAHAEIVAAVSQAREAGDDRALVATLLILGEVSFPRGEPQRGIDAYAEAVEAARRAGDARLELEAQQSFVVAKAFVGEFDYAEHERVYALAVAVGDPWIEATCLTNIALRHRTDGELDLAIPRFQAAIERFRMHGDDATAGQVMLFLGMTYIYAGRLDDAEAVLVQAREHLAHRGPEVHHMADLALAGVAVQRGEVDEARGMFDELIRRATADSAAETLVRVRIERAHLSCLARDQRQLRTEVDAIGELDRVRSFEVQMQARALRAAVADIDVEGTPALDALGAELESEAPAHRAQVPVLRALTVGARGWSTGAPLDPRVVDSALEEIATELPGFDPMRVFDLRRWIDVVEKMADRGGRALRISPDYAAAKPPDQDWISLKTKGRSRAVIRALVERRLSEPGVAISADELFSLAWPDTEIRHESALARVYTAMSEIRKMGFSSVLSRTDAGYLIPDDVEIIFPPD